MMKMIEEKVYDVATANDGVTLAKSRDMKAFTDTLVTVRDLEEFLRVLNDFKFQLSRISTYFEDSDEVLHKELRIIDLTDKVDEYVEKVNKKADQLTTIACDLSDKIVCLDYKMEGKINITVDTEEDYRHFMGMINNPDLTKTPVIVINDTRWKEEKE